MAKKKALLLIIISFFGFSLLVIGITSSLKKPTNSYSKEDIINNNITDTVYIEDHVRIDDSMIFNNKYYIDQKNNIFFMKSGNLFKTVSFYEEDLHYTLKNDKYEKVNNLPKPFYLIVYDILQKEKNYNIGINNITNINSVDFNKMINEYSVLKYLLNSNGVSEIDNIEQITVAINDSKKIEEINIICVSDFKKISISFKISLSTEKVDTSLFK